MRKAARITKRLTIQAGRSRVGGTSPPEGAAQRNYKVISISLYSDQAELVDRATLELLHAGYPKANRSLVIQAAVQRLWEEIEGKSPADILKYFLERHVRRPLARVSRPDHEATDSRASAHPVAGEEK